MTQTRRDEIQEVPTGLPPSAVLLTNGAPECRAALEVGTTLVVALGWSARLVGIDEGAGTPRLRELRADLAKAETRLREAGLNVEVEIRSGDGPGVIADEALGESLLIFGPLGRSALRRLIRGRTVRHILQQARAPILYVGPSSIPPRFQHVLICSGGLGHAEAAVRLVGQMTAGLGGQLTLLHVSIPFQELPEPVRDVPDQEQDYLQTNTIYARALRKQLAWLRQLGLEPEFRLRRGDPYTEIMAELRTHEFDLVAIGSHAVVGPIAGLVGDLTHRIAERAGIPVLVVRGPIQAPHP